MGSKNKNTPVISGTAEEIIDKLKAATVRLSERDFAVQKASIVDALVSYDYIHTGGINQGDKHHVDGTGIIKPSLQDAFSAFNVHLAVIDEHFKHDEIEDILRIPAVDFQDYSVHAFRVSEKNDTESVVLVGTKYTDLGVMNIETPKIILDAWGNYKWYNELKTALDKARNEVSLYKEGNFDAPEVKEKKTKKSKQLSLADQVDQDDDLESNND